MPIQVIHHTQSLIEPTNGVMQTAMDAIYIGFYFLLRRGEYVKTPKNHSLLVRNVTFRTPDRRPKQSATARFSDIRSAISCAIIFDTQKNRTKGGTIGHGKTGHAISCPTEALKRPVLHLRQSGAPSNIPLCSHSDGTKWIAVKSHTVTKLLRYSVRALPELHYTPADVSKRSLRSGGAMALLLAGVDKNLIQLVWRWRRDAIFRYLHAQALLLVHPLVAKTLQHGSFTLMPGDIAPEEAEHLLANIPPAPGQQYYAELTADQGDEK
jgi:hypothetical protein